MRSHYSWGCPLKGYERYSLLSNKLKHSCDDRRREQEHERLEFVKTVANYLKSIDDPDIGVYYIGTFVLASNIDSVGSGITDWEIDWIIYNDVFLAAGSVLFVFSWMLFHTQSLMLSGCGIVHIMVSIPTYVALNR